jgi:hypothetical protein
MPGSMDRRTTCPLACLAAGLAGLAGVAFAAAASDDDAAAWRQRGAALILPFKKELKAALQEGLAKGPEQAIDACRIRAPAIARAASVDGARVGRTSRRLRNPANAPAPWMEPVLDRYAADPERSEPTVVALPDDRVGYAEPIRVQPLCLTCHGSALPESVSARLAVLYPDDEATGYEVGDFRGLFWAEFPTSTQTTQPGADER